jgi:hypothetical protein
MWFPDAKRDSTSLQHGNIPAVDCIDQRRVVCSVEEVRGDVDDPDAVKVDEQMAKGALLVVGLEEHAVLVDVVKAHKALRWQNVNEPGLLQSATCDSE